MQEDYWNINITSKQFVGKDSGGLKWFDTDIFCSHHMNISRLTGRSSSAKKGSKLIITGELEISEGQLYCDVHHFEFVSQLGSKNESIKRDPAIWIEDDEDEKTDFNSPSRRRKKVKQEEPTTSQVIIPSLSQMQPPSPATLVSDSSPSWVYTSIKRKKNSVKKTAIAASRLNLTKFQI